MVQLFSENFVLFYKKIHLKLDAPRALIIKFYTVPTNVNSVTEEVDRLSQFSASSFFNFFCLSTLWIPQMRQLHVPELSLLLLSKKNLIAWTTISVKAKRLKEKNLVGKKKPNQSHNSVDQI